MMLLSGSVLLITVFAFLLRSRSLRVSSLRPSGLTIVLGVSSSAALLVSSVVLRLSYQPYADTMQHFIRDGGETGLANLSDFLRHACTSVGSGWLKQRQEYSFYFWFALMVLCTLAPARRRHALLPGPSAEQCHSITSTPCQPARSQPRSCP